MAHTFVLYHVCEKARLGPTCVFTQSDQSLLSTLWLAKDLGPVVQSVVSLTSLLRVISLSLLADSIHNILIFFAEKM